MDCCNTNKSNKKHTEEKMDCCDPGEKNQDGKEIQENKTNWALWIIALVIISTLLLSIFR